MLKEINSKTGCQRNRTGFRTKNRISGFLLTSLKITMRTVFLLESKKSTQTYALTLKFGRLPVSKDDDTAKFGRFWHFLYFPFGH